VSGLPVIRPLLQLHDPPRICFGFVPLVSGKRRRGASGAQHLVLRISNRLLLCEILCDAPHMATNVAIDPDLFDRAVAVSGERTKTATVKRALEEFIARRLQSKIVDLFGTLEWDPKYDYKTARSRD
jgi:hypothetical protein